MTDSGKHSHGATDPYIAAFLDSRLETQYSIRELTRDDLQLTSLDSLRNEGITYVAGGGTAAGELFTDERMSGQRLRSDRHLLCTARRIWRVGQAGPADPNLPACRLIHS